MPTAEQHQAKCAANRTFLTAFSHDSHPDWAAVAAFYTAVHAVERLRETEQQQHSRNHHDRKKYIQKKHPQILSQYNTLLDISLYARYDSISAFLEKVGLVDITNILIGQHLVDVESYINNQITTDLA